MSANKEEVVARAVPFTLDMSEIQIAIPIDQVVKKHNKEKKLRRIARNALCMFYNLAIAELIPFDSKGNFTYISVPFVEFAYQKGYQVLIKDIPFDTPLYSREYRTLHNPNSSRYFILEE